MKKKLPYTLVFVALILIGGGWLLLTTIGERNRPVIQIGPEAGTIGRQKEISVSLSDAGQGLRSAEIAIVQDNIPRVMAALDFAGKRENEKKVAIAVDVAALKLHDGPAEIRIVVVDNSLWKNRAEAVLPTQIDLLPPQIFLRNSQNYINIGGTGVISYGLSEPVSRTGVQAGDTFYPAHKTALAGQEVYVAFFALPDEAPPAGGVWQIAALAVDGAGNETAQTIPAVIRKKKFHSDRIALADDFLNRKMPEFQTAMPELRGKTPLETFIAINTIAREENLMTIQAECRKTEPRMLWDGPFLRMKNAAPRAFFGDRRTYLYNGQQISQSIHNGVDLASTAQAPIEAANNGIVRFTGMIGIYGNSVIIDHGMGVATLYSHLSSIAVKPEQTVKKGEQIGLSGATGLAGGDHLHFGIAVNGIFVDPVEWWDPHWIVDNVTKKLAQ